MKIWILIWRLQPMHLWHQRLIDNALKDNNKIIIFLWSDSIIDPKNIYSTETRKYIISTVYHEYIVSWKIILIWLVDNPSDKIWLENIEKFIWKYCTISHSEINIYCGDLKDDYAIRVINENRKAFLIGAQVTIIELARTKKYSLSNKSEMLISSTRVRKSLAEWDDITLVSLLSHEVYQFIKQIW